MLTKLKSAISTLKVIFNAIVGFFKGFKALSEIDTKLDKINEDVKILSQDVKIIRRGLQSELSDTLLLLYEQVMEKGWANGQERSKAVDIHAKLQELGTLTAKDEYYYSEIEKAPKNLLQLLEKTSHIVK